MAGLVPAIHDFAPKPTDRREWPGQAGHDDGTGRASRLVYRAVDGDQLKGNLMAATAEWPRAIMDACNDKFGHEDEHAMRRRTKVP
jgi:hypothetical protein